MYFKVRVPKIDAALYDLPKDYKDTSNIDNYGDFTAPPNLILRLGDKVEVTYGDMMNYKNGIIIRKIAQSMQDIILPAGGYVDNPVSAYDGTLGDVVTVGRMNIEMYPQERKYLSPEYAFRTYYSLVRKQQAGRKATGTSLLEIAEKNANTYIDIIRKASSAYGVPVNIIRAIITKESNYRKTSSSGAKARGLMQLMPSTGFSLDTNTKFKETIKGVKPSTILTKSIQFCDNDKCYNLFIDLEDEVVSIFGGTKVFADFLKMFGNNLQRGLSSYNAGPGTTGANSKKGHRGAVRLYGLPVGDNGGFLDPEKNQNRENVDYIHYVTAIYEHLNTLFPGDA